MVNAPVVAAALLAAGSVVLVLPWRPPPGPTRTVVPAQVVPSPAGPAGERVTTVEHHALRRHRYLVAACCAVAPPMILGGLIGFLAGVATAVWVWRALGSLESAGSRRRRQKSVRDLPHAVDLLAVVMASGASTSAALDVVVDAVDPPLATELLAVRHGLALGRDPVHVWRDAGRRPGLATLARTMVRALDTGASVSDALHRLADDLHAVGRLDDEMRARSVGVRVAAPLGLCLLPAFVLIGVVPLVGGTVMTFVAP